MKLLSQEWRVQVGTSKTQVLGPDPKRRRIILPMAEAAFAYTYSFQFDPASASGFMVADNMGPVILYYEDYGEIITHPLYMAAKAQVANFIFWTASLP